MHAYTAAGACFGEAAPPHGIYVYQLYSGRFYSRFEESARAYRVLVARLPVAIDIY